MHCCINKDKITLHDITKTNPYTTNNLFNMKIAHINNLPMQADMVIRQGSTLYDKMMINERFSAASLFTILTAIGVNYMGPNVTLLQELAIFSCFKEHNVNPYSYVLSTRLSEKCIEQDYSTFIRNPENLKA